MKWWPTSCSAGDMIRVRIGSICHYGVYVSDDEVIQFGPPPRERFLPPEEVRVCVTTIDEFACGDIIETAQWTLSEKMKKNSPRKAISLARSRIGTGGYNLLHNNCEHFAYECVLGKKYCEQEEAVREQWRNRPLLNVYLMKLPETDALAEVFPKQRADELKRTTHPLLHKQRYWVWKLLEEGIRQTFGWKMEELSFKKQRNGKWTCDRLYFSLTHAEDWVAAAVSNRPIGIDMEPIGSADGRPWDKLAEKILCEDEQRFAQQIDPEKLLALWTRKESAFKRSDAARFQPSKVSGMQKELVTLLLENDYLFSACAEKLGCIRLYQWDGESVQNYSSKEWIVE